MKWFLIGLAFYLLYRMLTRRWRKTNTTSNFRFGHFNNQKQNNRKQNNNLDQIEEAEFEDITEEDITEKEEKN